MLKYAIEPAMSEPRIFRTLQLGPNFVPRKSINRPTREIVDGKERSFIMVDRTTRSLIFVGTELARGPHIDRQVSTASLHQLLHDLRHCSKVTKVRICFVYLRELNLILRNVHIGHNHGNAERLRCCQRERSEDGRIQYGVVHCQTIQIKVIVSCVLRSICFKVNYRY